jgi:hypothetical protein
MSKWKTMGSAPKDGTDVLVFDHISQEQFVAFYRENGWCFASRPGGPHFVVAAPKFWQPLLPNPTDEGTQP